MIPLGEMKTAADSAKYEASKLGMWFDTSVMTPEFLRSILQPGMDTSLSHIIDIFKHLIQLYSFYLIIPILLLIFLSISVLNKKTGLTLFAFQILVFIILYSLDYNGRLLDGRHFLNIQIVVILISLYIIFPILKDVSSKRHISIMLLLIILCFSGTIVTLSNYKERNRQNEYDVDCYKSAMQKLESSYQNKLIVLTISTYQLFDKKVSFYNKNYLKNKYIIFDGFTFSLTPPYMEYLDKICRCNNQNPQEFFDWLIKEDALYICQPQTQHVLKQYMNAVHHYPLNLSPVEIEISPCIENTLLREYIVYKVGKDN